LSFKALSLSGANCYISWKTPDLYQPQYMVVGSP